MKNIKEEIEKIKSSVFFNASYYLKNYPDVRKSGIDPIEHYLLRGASENRNPSQFFDTAYYVEKYPDVLESKMNPLIHYLEKGSKEGRTIKKPKYFLTLAACIKNEGNYLEEWLSYYIFQGVEHFYLNNDESTDNTEKVLKPFIEKGYVTVYKGLRKKGILQADFYNKIIKEKKNESEWCCFFDADEFYQGEKKLSNFLKSLDSDISGIELFWKIYGDSHLEKYGDKFVTERFVFHCNKKFPPTQFVKSICRLENTKKTLSIHVFEYKKGKVINALKKDITNIDWGVRTHRSSPIWEICWINHYHNKTLEEYSEKLARGNADGTTRTNSFDYHNRNDIYNDSMKFYSKEIGKIIASIKNVPFKTYENQIKEIENSGLFDEKLYLQENPEILKMGFNAIEHYLKIGEAQKRNPSSNFDIIFYLESYPDVAKSDFSPLVHYIRHGKSEGRRAIKAKYFLAMAASIKNEGRYLDEWLAYYIYQGVEHFYLNNDESTDNTLEILKPYIEKGYVTLYESLRKEGIFQGEFYDKIIQEKKYETEWCCFFDVDEFYQGEKSLKDFLLSMKNSVSGIELFWKTYGSSGLEKYEDSFVLERFIKHIPLELKPKEFVKSICRLRNTKGNASVHCFHYERGKVVNALLEDITNISWGNRTGALKPIWERCWINHYFFKSREEYVQKIARGSAATGKAPRPDYFYTASNNNDAIDDSMKEYIGAIKEIILKIKSEKIAADERDFKERESENERNK